MQDLTGKVLEEDGEGGGPDYTVFLRKTDGSPAIRLGSGMGLAISPDDKWMASTSVKQPAPIVLLPAGAGQPVILGDGQLFHTSNLHFLPDGKGLIMVATEKGKAPRTLRSHAGWLGEGGRRDRESCRSAGTTMASVPKSK